MTRILALIAALAAATPALADEVTETLQSALQAYEDGDIQYALDEIEFAKQKLMEMKTSSLGAFLPAAPDGWSVEINSDMNTGLAMMGGGVGAEANYKGPDGQDVKLTLMADNPMVASMGAMVANAAVMGMKVERIGRQRFAVQDEQILGLIGNRVLVQTEGDLDSAKMLLGEMDFKGLGNFGL
ncbi:hypothetical protein [Pacificoceanicola onchidii]|uniref:hypothetical protein n=1 Tax=Pacificoceanicola onchidii TaxID=2562685 RepID=UPI0010A5D07B|nr:hypothetical protein [Pacificoceanicola onchidii]